MPARLQHVKRAARVHEVAAEKLRARLAAQVTAEERRCKRNAEAYTRARRTIAANRGTLLDYSYVSVSRKPELLTPSVHVSRMMGVGGLTRVSAMMCVFWVSVSHRCPEALNHDLCPDDMKRRATAGAVSAALRELRPVEIVGLYEDVLESHQVAVLPKTHNACCQYVTSTRVHASVGFA